MTEQEQAVLLARLDERTEAIKDILENQITPTLKLLPEHETRLTELETCTKQHQHFIVGLFVWVGAFFTGVAVYVLNHIGFPRN